MLLTLERLFRLKHRPRYKPRPSTLSSELDMRNYHIQLYPNQAPYLVQQSAICNANDTDFTHLCSDPAVHSPPRCHSDLSAQKHRWLNKQHRRINQKRGIHNSTLEATQNRSVCANTKLTSHPYSPDRTSSDANRHLSRDYSQQRKQRGFSREVETPPDETCCF